MPADNNPVNPFENISNEVLAHRCSQEGIGGVEAKGRRGATQ